MINKWFTYALVLSCTTLVISCGSNKPQTLASLSDTSTNELKDEDVEIESLTHEQVRNEYEALLDVFEEEKLKEKIERRIADVYMMEGVYQQNTDTEKESYFGQATEAYLDVLEKYPNSPENAEIFYQLSKSYDLEGNQDAALDMLIRLTTQYPDYENITEAWFRRGDIHYSNGDYGQAQTAYTKVALSKEDKFELNAHYMLGWSNYKQLNFRSGVESFSLVVNRLLGRSQDLARLEPKQRSLAEESINSISLSLDKIGGAGEIEVFEKLAGKNYVWLVYDDLGKYYLDKERYEDAAGAYRLFVANYQNSNKAPSMHENIISAYETGGFTRQTLVEKENYVAAYGLKSEYTKNRGGISPEVAGLLEVYLDELASYFHGLAQAEQKVLDKEQEKDESFRDLELEEKRAVAAVAAFDKAADYYGQFATTFPDNDRVDKIYFLRAETLFSAYRFQEAAEDYERVAYKAKGSSANEHLNNAGYAAIIAYQNHLDDLVNGSSHPGRSPRAPIQSSREISRWKERSTGSMLKFVDVFYQDERSPSVLTSAADYLMASEQYKRAVKVTETLVADHEDLNNALKKTAYGITGLGYFRLEDFQSAEDNYFSQRQLVDPATEEYTKISERLGLSIYRKAQGMIEAGEKQLAIVELLKIKNWTPVASARVPAQYDASSLLLEAENWSAAIAELEELDANYRSHELALEFPRKLAFAYEKNSNWGLAAETYTRLADNDPDVEVRQQALFVSGFMFEKNKDYKQSIEKLTRYTEEYSQPFDNYMEASYQLALNYQAIEDQANENIWLDKIIAADRQSGSQRTERSQWLAAWANTEYGDYYSEQFDGVSLAQPIAQTVGPKNDLLQRASERYESAAEYGFFEFVTMSSYKIGKLYQTFANELRAVPPPESLSADDQQVYKSIIEEQAEPFDQLAVDLYQANIEKAWGGEFNEWIANSFEGMQTLNPTRYSKRELIVSYGDGIY